jgi:Xaa-Pro dipeptidase
MTEARLSTLQSLIASSASDFVALLPGPNLRYLTGLSFHLMERPVVAIFPREGES